MYRLMPNTGNTVLRNVYFVYRSNTLNLLPKGFVKESTKALMNAKQFSKAPIIMTIEWYAGDYETRTSIRKYFQKLY